MLTICVGPNGSGKSLWAMHQIEELLMRDSRTIVTSLSVDKGALNEYLAHRYGEKCPDVMRRVMLIGLEEQSTYWRYRGCSGNLSKVVWRLDGGVPKSSGEFAPIKLGEYGDETWRMPGPGIIYVLDEIHKNFGAREWAKRGPEFVSYQSEHRHLSDDVIAITPQSGLLDKQFRMLCGECVVLTNLYKLRKGWLKAPRKIEYRTYQNCPPLPGEDHMIKGSLEIDVKGLASCYRTEEGVGIVGQGGADKGRESRGIPWWCIFPAGIVAALLMWFAAKAVLGGAMWWGLGRMKVAEAKSAGAEIMGGLGVTNNLNTAVERGLAGQAKTEMIETLGKSYTNHSVQIQGVTNKLNFRGYMKLGGKWQVLLGDGRIIERSVIREYEGRLFVPGFGWLTEAELRPGEGVKAPESGGMSDAPAGGGGGLRYIRVIDGKTGVVLRDY